MTNVFRFLPGERVRFIYGMPGPDTEECEVLQDDGKRVLVRYQIFGRGEFFEDWKPRTCIVWMPGSEISQRHAAWKRAQAADTPPLE